MTGKIKEKINISWLYLEKNELKGDAVANEASLIKLLSDSAFLTDFTVD